MYSELNCFHLQFTSPQKFEENYFNLEGRFFPFKEIYRKTVVITTGTRMHKEQVHNFFILTLLLLHENV